MTGGLSALAGANVLIAGTSIFGKDRKRGSVEVEETISVKSKYQKLLEIMLKSGQ